jgi:hypothetical protein
MPGYGTPLGLTLPTIDGVAKESAAAPLINTALSAIIARLEGKVGAADLDINADVSFKSGAVYSGAKDLHRAAFQSQTSAITAVSNPNTVYVLSGNLHYIDGSGNLVQITSGGQVNVSTTGGITGAGYGTSGVEFNWDSVNVRFSAKSGAGANDFADLQCSDLLLRDGSSNQIRVQSPSLAGDYTFTLPTALPGAQALMHIDNTGQITASNSLATNAHLTLVGTGEVKHGNRQLNISAAAALPEMTNTPNVGGNFNDNTGVWASTALGGLIFPLPLLVGDRVLQVEVMYDGVGSAGTRTVELLLNISGSGSGTSVVTSATSTSTTTGFRTFNIADTTLGSLGIYSIRYSSTTNADVVAGIRVTYDRP